MDENARGALQVLQIRIGSFIGKSMSEQMFSINEFSKLAGMSPHKLSSILKGESLPSLTNVVAFSIILKITPNDVLGFNNVNTTKRNLEKASFLKVLEKINILSQYKGIRNE